MPYGVGVGMQGALGIARLRALQDQQRQQGILGLGQAAGGLGQGIQALQARRKQEAAQEDIQNVLGGGEPTTPEGAQIRYKMDQDALGQGNIERTAGLAQERFDATQDRAKAATGIAAEERAGAIRAGRTEAGFPAEVDPRLSFGATGGPVVGMLPPGIQGPTTIAEVESGRRQRAGEAAGAEQARVSGLGERKMRLAEQTEERRGQPAAPDPLLDEKRRYLEARIKKVEKAADSRLERDFPNVKPLTRTAAVSAAISVLKSRTDEEGIVPDFTSKEVTDIAKAILKGVNVPRSSGPEGDGLDAEWDRLKGGE